MKAEEIIKKHDLNRTTWTFKGFHGILFTFHYVGAASTEGCYQYYHETCKNIMFYVKDDYVRWYWPDEDMRKLRTNLIINVNKDPNYLKKVRSNWSRALKKFDHVLNRIEKIKLEDLSDTKLFDLYDKFYDTYIAEFGIVITLQDAFSMYSSEFLEPLFMRVLEEQKRQDKFMFYYTKLLSPIEDSFISLEMKSRLRILKEVNQAGWDSEKVRKLVRQHQQNFYWIRNNYAKQEVLSEEFFVGEIKKFKKLDPDEEINKIDSELRNNIEEKKEIIKELGLSQDFINLIRISETYAYFQDERKKYVLIANYYIRLLIREVARRRNLSVKTIENLVYPELKKEFDPANIDERRNGCLYIKEEGSFYIYQGDEVETVHESLFGSKSDINDYEIKGVTASLGYAKGTVKIVRKTHDLINFNKGDILVASMTRPEMVVAMKNAAAIVTDEGGITSHAAIVSRELKIPCVIGTKHATHIFKDGDVVEVDASKGTVRKIE